MMPAISQVTSICTPVVLNDSSVIITTQQLKTANLIFNEHFNLKIENNLLNQQISSYKLLYEDELKVDSLYKLTITDLEQQIVVINSDLEKQRLKCKKHVKLAKWLGGYSLGTSVLIALICVL